ncbi:non-ribosomal peptide synthetase [Pseudonocardia sp. Cha107L01]|uniref:non-ribosomal peptide synthetase n=1 Tax=Pseudonocardia sp. Cha107L01 TaxID=3457576 RepID=UPI00403E87D5
MGVLAGSGREFWSGVLRAGGCTTIPRWVTEPTAGVAEVAEVAVTVPDDVATALSRVAGECAVPRRSMVLAAHAAVLAALCGERRVVTGYVAVAGGPALPCGLDTGAGSWRALLRDTARVESELRSHRDFPIEELTRELGSSAVRFETVFDAVGGEERPTQGTAPTGGAVLWLDLTDRAGRFRLRLRYRTDVLNAGAAARIAGYHQAALASIATAPDAHPAQRSLLSAEELAHQLDGLAGPRRELPDARLHELFERRVAAHPDTVAAVQGDVRWTYRELNAHANRLGRALLARGLGREGVVAVVTERTLDWMAAVLAVFKAGGVYLPIEPHFPAERIATTLSRAGARLVLTEAGGSATLRSALASLPQVDAVDIDRACAELAGRPGADADLGVAVGPDQLAYIYFTSGSTGTPKGAMCEHAGMLNHVYAKIEDLGVGEGAVIAQTAPQCFDISLWQLVAALLVGGRTLLVEQKVVLDVARFVDTIADGRVGVLQVVPSYLEAVLSQLEADPRELPDLRCVSATGEALKPKLVQRWFAAMPGTTLVNAYGLTETSDDTNHEVMRGVPESASVPLGRCIRNVSVYVVDEQLRPVPLGAPGLIVFSGVCVGRGYVNDPERTAQAYRTDPYRPGARLYLGGDYGRWRPRGTLEFLGRRDHQVKIRGFRIEIGEIENALLRVPGVRDAAVVVLERDGQDACLVAFCAGERPVGTDAVRGRLAASLPEYMVPPVIHWRDALPLTANSKIDRTALVGLAAELGALGGALGDSEDVHRVREAPRTQTERRLALAWATVLGVPAEEIGRRDHFFDRGGSSLSAVKLAIALNRAVSLKDITRHPVLAELASLVDAAPGAVFDEARRPARRPASRQPTA